MDEPPASVREVEEAVSGIRSGGTADDASPNRSSFKVQSFQSQDDAAPMGSNSYGDG